MGHDSRFDALTFDDFRRMAQDQRLTRYEKIGFPNSYREGFEPTIFADLESKLPALGSREQVVVDIGVGCSQLPELIRARCEEQGHTLVLVDSEEMLAHHPDGGLVRKFPGRFPRCPEMLSEFAGRANAIIAYSVLHYVYPQESVFAFLDSALELLAPGGRVLIGDIPNVSKRRRFLSSSAGVEFHRAFTGSDEPPEVGHFTIEPDRIDDAVVLGLLMRARNAGYDAYLVPQHTELPMANRREDLLVCRP